MNTHTYTHIQNIQKSFIKPPQTKESIKRKLLKPFKDFKRNCKDKDYVYKRCNKCKTIVKLPLPSKRGIKHAKCPKCKKRLTFITLKKLKIEIIKKR